MEHTLEAFIASNNITSIPFDSDKLADIASSNLFENFGLSVAHVSENRSLIAVTDEAKENGILYSTTFANEYKALVAKKIMLDDWGIETEIKSYDSETLDDGYDMDVYY